jgi:type II secretory ATPase GspE/PulE/Tfp pilus assembly ATPase PilB-like protein
MIYTKEAKDERIEFMYGKGCSTCAQTGYMGRVGIYEVLRMSDAIRMMLIKGTSTSELKATALKEGMVTLLKDGMLKVKSNLTTPSEVLRNAYSAE